MLHAVAKSWRFTFGLTLSATIGSVSCALAMETIEIAPGKDVQEQLQEALILVEPGGTIQLQAGTYALSDGLSLDVAGVTVKGAGPDKTILSFKGQETGSEGLLVTADKVTLEGFAIEDTKGDAFKSKGVDEITLRDLRAEWTGGPNPENGAYGFYPVESTNVLIDTVEAKGASDAGIYVGQSQHIIVRNSLAHYNVAGIEIENSYFADVYDNLATHNTGGILVFDLPGLPMQGGHHVRVFRNKSVDNDTPNFAPEGNIVGSVPMGTGIMIMANRDVEVFDNDLSGNATVNLLIASYMEDFDDKTYQPHPAGIHIHNNRFGKGGYAPDNEIGQLLAEIGGTPIPDIVFDGRRNRARGLPLIGASDAKRFAIHDNGDADFVNLRVVRYYLAKWLHRPARNLDPYAEPRPALAAVKVAQDHAAQ